MTQDYSIQSIQSRTIDCLRFPMAALVVLLHTAALGVGSSHPVYSTLCIAFGRGICRVAVPCFFLISGYLFFSKLEDQWDTHIWLDKLKKRVRTLLIPYILWNLIAGLAIWGYHWLFARMHGEAYPTLLESIVQSQGLWDASGGLPFDGPLWFIRYLMIFVLAAPLFWLFIKYLRGWGILVLTLVFVTIGFIPEGVVFFAAGAWFRIEKKNMLDTFDQWKYGGISLAVLSLVILTLSFRNHPDLYRISSSVFILSGTVFFFLLAGMRVKKEGQLHPLLVHSSFFIFAAHNILILHDFSHWIILHALPFQGEWVECIDLFLRPSIAVAICLLLYKAMERMTPRTLSLLTGGRG
ncbi:MAG: acyltransferase [Bacteroidales bacterium]|nr:acyltransferase [Bacteroidales bacterium]